jgi:hypothetical protein
MKRLTTLMIAVIVIVAAALGWDTVGASWWGSDHDYYYDRPWYGGPWYGGYGPYGWGGRPYGWGGGPYGWGYGPYGWGGGPYGWRHPQIIQIYGEPEAPESQQSETITVH